MPRPIRATIRASALTANLAVARRAAERARLWAVVKADAYGHGLRRAVRVLRDADGIALLDVGEGVALREAGERRPILLLEGCFSTADLELAARHALTTVVHHREQVRMLEARSIDSPVDVYLKVNTGMNRLGFAAEDARAAWSALRGLAAEGRVGTTTWMTHFADADGASGIATQLERFDAVTRDLPSPRSLANSAALLRHPQARGDWARPGIMLYGGSPFVNPGTALRAADTALALDLAPVMTLCSEIIGVQRLRPGDRVGYGGTFEARSPMRVGVVACGYADGYPRHAPSGTPVLVAGGRTVTVGRVSMDMIVVDLTEDPSAEVGSPVVLWGEGLPADEVANAAGTVSYELFCALAPRVPVIEIE